jgi:hypothetical protein
MHHVTKVLTPSTSRNRQASPQLTLRPHSIKINIVHPPSIGLSLWNFYFTFMIVHLSVGVDETLVALRTLLLFHFVYPYERKITIDCYA